MWRKGSVGVDFSFFKYILLCTVDSWMTWELGAPGSWISLLYISHPIYSQSFLIIYIKSDLLTLNLYWFSSSWCLSWINKLSQIFIKYIALLMVTSRIIFLSTSLIMCLLKLKSLLLPSRYNIKSIAKPMACFRVGLL